MSEPHFYWGVPSLAARASGAVQVFVNPDPALTAFWTVLVGDGATRDRIHAAFEGRPELGVLYPALGFDDAGLTIEPVFGSWLAVLSTVLGFEVSEPDLTWVDLQHYPAAPAATI